MPDLPFVPPQASTIAGQVDLLTLILLGLSSTFTLIIVALIVYFSIKYRRGSDADRSNAPTGNARMEIAWMAGLFVLSAFTFTYSTKLYFEITNPHPDALEVYVVGQQWMWKFQHAAGPREINELHLPRGRPVRLIMTSQDVIHSLYIPAFRLKFDVIPGRYTNLWFEASRTGEYHLFCAEYCGTEHAEMGGEVIVMEPREYQDWLSARLGEREPGQALEEAGANLFEQLGCAGCHLPPGAAGAGERAPALEGVFNSQVSLANGESVLADENYLRESILLPEEKVVAGYEPTTMPTYQGQIGEEQVLTLIAYIKSLSSDGESQ